MHRSICRIGRHVKTCTPCQSIIQTAKVNTLTPLASAFDNVVQSHIETTSAYHVGLFQVPELKTKDGFHTLKDHVHTTVNGLVDKAISVSPSPDVVTIFDTLSNELCKVADLAEFIRLSHPDASIAKAAESTSFEIGGLVEKLNTHNKLYKALKNAVLFNSENMDSVTKTVADLFLFDFEQSGIHLHSSHQTQAVKLHEAILLLGSQFTQGTSLPREYPVGDWPKDLRIVHALTDKSTILVDSVYSETNDSRLREQCYKAFMSPCKNQLYLLESLLYCRDKLATILGFKSYAHRTLKNTLGSSPDNVVNFLDRTLCMLEKPLRKELDIILMYRNQFDTPIDDSLKPWDIRYYTSIIPSQLYNRNWKTISEYFSLGSCMNGLNIIFTSLFGVSLNVIEAAPGEVWAPDVQKVEVRHESEGVLGHIYCDFFQRPGKLPQDCHFTIRGGKLLEDGSYQSPIVCLMCNFPSPARDKPSLLTQSMVENLFHEMGHAMHSMLGRARYQHVTGTRCATDFAEVPSILMEYFCRDPRIIRLYAKHYKTGQPLPQEIMEGMLSSRKLFPAIDLQVQAFYAIVDQKFHGEQVLGKSINDTLDNLHNEYTPLSHVAGTSWHLRFSHFHSYGAKYYAYVLSKAVASSIWYNCFENDPLSRSVGQRYREMMLKHGGGKPPQEMVEDMLEKRVTVDDFVNSLQFDLASSREKKSF